RACRVASPDYWRLCFRSDSGAYAVRTDRERRRETHLRAARIAGPHPGDPVGAVANELRHGGLVEDVGACGSCGIDEQSVEEVTARCIECVHTTARFDHDIDVVAI